MLQFDNAPNFDLISAITGKAPAVHLVERYGRLADLAQASFDDLQHVPGVGKSKAAAIKSAFLLAQRAHQRGLPRAPPPGHTRSRRQPATGTKPSLRS